MHENIITFSFSKNVMQQFWKSKILLISLKICVFMCPNVIWAASWKTTTKWSVRPAKKKINLGIRPVWSESSQCAQWVAKDPRFLHADSEDSDRTGRMPRLIWVFAGRTCHFVGFVVRWLICIHNKICHIPSISNWAKIAVVPNMNGFINRILKNFIWPCHVIFKCPS